MYLDQNLRNDQEFIRKIKINKRSVASKNIIDRGDKYGITDAPNTTTLAEGALQPTTKEQDKSRKVVSLLDTLLTDPGKVAPAGTQLYHHSNTECSN